ncbi:glycosyltransferase family 4 protein [Sodalis sp. dw_96]|uniref:glycosyltransferase family 4 protein n=1 Tax=Sodalis sp. dw_96 TaxID=2719794 RepID=UPI001BD4C402|nr:glycosyltransferase family 4 protein [Sodalis sp. dw_96]
MEEINLALVADWLITYGGGEKVLSELLKIFPNSELYSVIDFLSNTDREKLQGRRANTTYIQKFPFVKTKYKMYLPFMPLAIEQLDMSEYNVILSSSHAVAKGVITGPDQLHISYVHSPIRYAWDLQHQYLTESNLQRGLKSLLAKYFLHKLRIWDYRTVNSVDHFIANSQFIARRIWKIYGRVADVIYPPVNVDRFNLYEKKEEFYLTASRMVPYKKMDLIVSTFAKLPDKKLVVIGDGPEMQKIKKIATKNVEILGYQSDDILTDYMKKAKAFIFAAEEDFGISPVEAQACGTPVIAYGKGGALETIRPIGVERPTGIFFAKQTNESLAKAINFFIENECKILAIDCRQNAMKFSEERFHHEIKDYIENKWNLFQDSKKIKY